MEVDEQNLNNALDYLVGDVFFDLLVHYFGVLFLQFSAFHYFVVELVYHIFKICNQRQITMVAFFKIPFNFTIQQEDNMEGSLLFVTDESQNAVNLTPV